MNHQIKQLAIISVITTVVGSNAYAGCEWTNGSLGKTVEVTSARLKSYSECKKDCQSLETGLDRTISLMNTAKECDAGVLTAKNNDMVEFFNRRFNLIRKLKTGKRYVITDQAPKVVQLETRATKMNISSNAYQALWLDESIPQSHALANTTQSKPVQQISPSTVQATAAKQQALKIAHERRMAQQYQIQQQRLARIALQNERNADARKRKVLLVQHQERIRQKKLQHERAKAIHIAKQKAREQQFARAKN